MNTLRFGTEITLQLPKGHLLDARWLEDKLKTMGIRIYAVVWENATDRVTFSTPTPPQPQEMPSLFQGLSATATQLYAGKRYAEKRLTRSGLRRLFPDLFQRYKEGNGTPLAPIEVLFRPPTDTPQGPWVTLVTPTQSDKLALNK